MRGSVQEIWTDTLAHDRCNRPFDIGCVEPIAEFDEYVLKPWPNFFDRYVIMIIRYPFNKENRENSIAERGGWVESTPSSHSAWKEVLYAVGRRGKK